MLQFLSITTPQNLH